MYIVLGLLSAFFAALVAIFGKIGISKIDTTLATTMRALVMCLFFLATATALGKWKQFGAIDSRAMLFIVLSGLAGALSWLCYFWALKMGPTSAVVALDRLSVILTVVFAAIFLSEKVTLLGWLGATLMAVGAVMLTVK